MNLRVDQAQSAELIENDKINVALIPGSEDKAYTELSEPPEIRLDVDNDNELVLVIEGSGISKRWVVINTTEMWNSLLKLRTQKGVIYVYSDYVTIDGVTYPGTKIGDGIHLLKDIPMMQEYVLKHINDNVRHITDEEREFWNNKHRVYVKNHTIKITNGNEV